MATTILKFNGENLYSYNNNQFPKLHVGETLEFEESDKETKVQKSLYVVENIKHVFTRYPKRIHDSVDITTIIELKNI